MIVEEKKAGEHWCPHVRHPGEEGGTFNRGYEKGNEINAGRELGNWSCTCIGSRCMAWRWAGQKNYGEAKWNPDGSTHSTTHGYCGLGGRP